MNCSGARTEVELQVRHTAPALDNAGMGQLSILTNPRFGSRDADEGSAPGKGVVAIYTERVDELAAFYVHVLGFKTVSNNRFRSKPGHSSWLDAGSLTLLLHAPEGALQPPFDLAGNSIVLMLECDDAPADVRRRARAAGVHVEQGQDGNDRWLVIRDVEGRRIGMFCRG